jgi:hypothetical protein
VAGRSGRDAGSASVNGNGSGLWKAIAGACFTCAVGAVVWNFTQIASLSQSLAIVEGTVSRADTSASGAAATLEVIKQRQSEIASQLAKFEAIQQIGVERMRKIEEWEHDHEKEGKP